MVVVVLVVLLLLLVVVVLVVVVLVVVMVVVLAMKMTWVEGAESGGASTDFGSCSSGVMSRDGVGAVLVVVLVVMVLVLVELEVVVVVVLVLWRFQVNCLMSPVNNDYEAGEQIRVDIDSEPPDVIQNQGGVVGHAGRGRGRGGAAGGRGAGGQGGGGRDQAGRGGALDYPLQLLRGYTEQIRHLRCRCR